MAIADEAGIRDLARLKAATASLADPRRTNPEEAERIIAGARPIYYFNCSLHADETGSAEMGMELAYRLAVSEQPMIQAIRKNVVVLINPIAEPDGRDKVADWFYRYLKGKTDYETLPRQSPPYWNKYVYVDINRDAHQKAFGVTRAVHDMFYEYHPTVVHDLHEAIALLQTWNGTGPYNPNLDPIVTSQFLEMSFHEVTSMTSMGMPGVWTWNFGEGFGQHYLDSVAMNHNAIGRGYETYGNATPETFARALREGGGEQEDYLTREWYRPSPPPTHFRWSMRDNTNYQETGALTILDWAARHPKEMLRNFYRTGHNSWRKGVREKPYAFVIPAGQADPLRVAAMVGRLLDQHIEVGRLSADLAVAEGTFPRGSYVVKLDQPYRNYAVDVLAPQRFPAETPNLPYDDVSWAFPVGFGVTTVAIADERVKSAPAEPLLAAPAPVGSVTGDGAAFLLRDSGQEALLAARYRLARFKIEIAEASFAVAGVDYPAGSWIVPRQDGVREALDGVSRELALDFTAVAAPPDVARHEAAPPRDRRVGPVGRHRRHGLDSLHPRSREGPVHLPARRGRPRRIPARQGGRDPVRAVRPPRSGRADPRYRRDVRPDALRSHAGVPEPRVPRDVAGHHRWPRLRGPRVHPALRRERGSAAHPRRRHDARPRGRPDRRRTARANSGRLHPRHRAACDLRQGRSPDRLRLRPREARSSGRT